MIMDLIVEKMKEEAERHSGNNLYVSDILCLKRAELRRKYGSIFNPNYSSVFGKIVHLGAQEYLKELKSERKVNIVMRGMELSGRIDLVVSDNYIGEIKTTKKIDSEKIEYYKMQTAMYAKAFNSEYAEILILTPYKYKSIIMLQRDIDKYFEKADKIIKDRIYPVYNICGVCEYKDVCR